MEYIIHIIILILIYAILVESLNLIMGYAGVLSMCHAIFSGIGAYTAALISIHLGYNFIVGMAAGFVLAAFIGALLAVPSLKVRDEYLIVFTLGFQVVMFQLMLTARNITQGHGGITNIPSPELLGITFQTPMRFLPLVLIIALVCFAFAWRIIHSPFGRVLKSIREDEFAARALGKNTLSFKVIGFAVGGGLAAIAGSTLAYYVTFINPSSFTIEVSVLIIVMVVLGGTANFWGPLVGALILIGMPEVLRFVPGTAGIIDAVREVIYGGALVLLMLFRPQGILPEYWGKVGRTRMSSESSVERCDSRPNGQNQGKCFGRESSTSNILEIKELSKSFGGLQAVADVSMTLPAGKITGLIGPNGCGKTTLFNLITGFLSPEKGAIYIEGEEVTRWPPHKLVKRGIARSWQDVRIFKGMTVLDNVMVASPRQSGENLALLILSPWKVAHEEKENFRRAMSYLHFVGLSDKVLQLSGNLSPAEQKLVAIARLLATECPLLLFDEPTSALDIESIEGIIKLIRRIASQGEKTILLIEHNLDVVRGLVDNAYFMSEGKILDFGPPAELMSNPKLTEVYFGD
ncbi:MAG: branched-chain amino acid ABC transporter ATP-binding protein/permease [Pseudomonadota bacterium]